MKRDIGPSQGLFEQLMNVNSYLPRIADAELLERLESASAVVIEGPKGCGKTSTARRIASSEVFFDLDESSREAARLDPSAVLTGETPRLLDEWQVAPEIWNHVRRSADLEPGVGRFILTGSAAPQDDHIRHTGAGRISRMRMRTLSLFEQKVSSGVISTGELLAGSRISAPDCGLDIPELVEIICRGGWPKTTDMSLPQATRYVRDYLDEVRRADIPSATGVRHDPNKLLRLMQSLARNIATSVTLSTLSKDVSADVERVKEQTIGEYLGALERLFVIENQEPFAPHIRSRTRLRKASKRHFCDPSIATSVLRASPNKIRRDFEFLGLLFESMVVRDLRIYASHHDAEIRHYRDETNLEIDAIIETFAGDWMPVEIKLGGGAAIDAGAENLLKLMNRIDVKRRGAPAKLVVVTATGYAYERDDGVSVVPIGVLGP